MKIEKLNNNSYRIRKMYKGRTYTLILDYKPTQKEAMLLMAKKLDQDAFPEQTERQTFARAYKEYKDIKSNILSPATIRGYESIYRNMSEQFKNKSIHEITKPDIQKLVNDYSAEHSPKSTKNFYGLISAVLTMFRPEFNVTITLPQAIKKEPYIPSEDEIKKLKEYVKGTRIEIAVRLGCLAMRRSEICALDVATDLSHDNMLTINKALVLSDDKKWIIKSTKTEDSTRIIPISEDLAELMRTKEHKVYSGNPNQLTDDFINAVDRLKLQHFSFHKLRHFYASEAHLMNIPTSYIMYNGGWKSDKTLNQIYTHAFKDKQIEMQRKALEKIENL